MSTTTNLADFGQREREMLIELLSAWNGSGLPDDFSENGVHFMMNQNSGNVFLTNEEFEVAMMNDTTGALESFYTSPYEGKEGFFDDLKDEYKDMHPEDQEWFKSLAENLDKADELPSLDGEEESEEEEEPGDDE